MVAMFCMNPVFGRFLSHHYTTNVVEVDWNCNAIFASSLWRDHCELYPYRSRLKVIHFKDGDVVVNFSSQLIFVFLLFLGIVMYAC